MLKTKSPHARRRGRSSKLDLNHHTGEALDGWAHVVQSVETVIFTRLKTRVFSRDFGSEVPALVDMPMNDQNTVGLYVAIADALSRWEPRFDLTGVQVTPSADGVIVLELQGNYLPNAHLGDVAVVSDETKVIRVESDRVDSWSLTA